MSERRAARAARSAPKTIDGATIPAELLDVEAECRHDDAADLAGLGHRSAEVADAAIWLARRERHLAAVTGWAIEHGWTGRRAHIPDRARLLAAGVPVSRHRLDEHGDALAWPEDQAALYAIHVNG